jgi:hypothetical protein
MCLQFGFVIFWQKDFGAKAAHQMLVKLTPGWKIKDGTLISSMTGSHFESAEYNSSDTVL